jgi:hypothetical protein
MHDIDYYSNLEDTLTRTQAECTRLLEENRELKRLAKLLYEAVHGSPVRDLVNRLNSL